MGDSQKHGQRSYSARDVAVVLATACIVVVLLDGAGLRRWASRLTLGPKRDAALSVVEPVAFWEQRYGLDRPRGAVRESFLAALGHEREGGWETESPDLAASAPGPPPSVTTSDLVPEAPAADGEPARTGPWRILLIGDSLMDWGFGTSLEKRIADHPGMVVCRKAVCSSGLSRPDFFDWPAAANELLAETHYDAVVCILGGNDCQAISHGGKVLRHGDEAWFGAYGARAVQLVATLTRRCKRVYWLGLPPMRNAAFHEKTSRLNRIYRAACALSPKAVYVPTQGMIGDAEGAFATYLTIDDRKQRVRSSDGVHLTTAGGQIMADASFEIIRADFLEELGDTSRPIPLRCAWDGWAVASDCMARMARLVSFVAPVLPADEDAPAPRRPRNAGREAPTPARGCGCSAMPP